MNIEEILKQALSQVPALSVLVVVVIVFLRFMEKQAVFLKQMHEDHITARNESRLALKDNTDALRELAKNIALCPVRTITVDELKQRLKT